MYSLEILLGITIIYQLIAVATITFSKQKGVATIQGRQLHEGSH